jgi:GT2 family glycosyltransferase
MERFSVVIPLYRDEVNIRAFLEKNLVEIGKANPDSQILLVDDTGNENAHPMLRPRVGGNVVLIRHDRNRGFGRSVNEGVAAATAEIVFVFNSDIAVTAGAFEPALRHFQSGDVFAVTLKATFPDGGIREGAKAMAWKSGLPEIKHSPKDFPRPSADGRIVSFYPVGGHFAVRRSMFLQLGGYDAGLFDPFYWEDTDLGVRAMRRGWKTIYEPVSVVIHSHGHSTIKTHFDGKAIAEIRNRNRVFFALKNYGSFRRQTGIRAGLGLRMIQSFLKTGNPAAAYRGTLGLVKQYQRICHENRSLDRRTGGQGFDPRDQA